MIPLTNLLRESSPVSEGQRRRRERPTWAAQRSGNPESVKLNWVVPMMLSAFLSIAIIVPGFEISSKFGMGILGDLSAGPTAGAASIPKCQMGALRPRVVSTMSAAGTGFVIIRLVDTHAPCIAKQVVVEAFNSKSERRVGPIFRSFRLRPRVFKSGKPIYLPVGLVDTFDYSVASCGSALITGVILNFSGNASLNAVYLRLHSGNTVCTKRLTLTVEPYQTTDTG